MYIKEIKKKNKGSDKIYIYGRLIESYRTERGPRHRTILNLGELHLDKSKWKQLADRIEHILTGQSRTLLPIDEEVEKLAQHYAALLIKKKMNEEEEVALKEDSDYETVDLNSITTSDIKDFGGENICYSYLQKLNIPDILEKEGFTPRQVEIAVLLIIGRLLNPTSELGTLKWAKEISGLSELMSADFTRLSKNTLYKVSDLLIKSKETIEKELRLSLNSLFKYREKIILYDLTNTYFERRINGSEILSYGRSKEKRYDCPLATLGLVVDERGLPIRSKIFKGNISEPGTLEKVLNNLHSGSRKLEKPVVLIDAGIATSDNLSIITHRLKWDYVCVPRSKPPIDEALSENKFELIKTKKGSDLEVKLVYFDEKKKVVFCRSELKRQKEESIYNKVINSYLRELEKIKSSLSKNRGIKKYEKVLQRIGRLQEKYGRAAYLYDVEVIKNEDGIAVGINWERNSQKAELLKLHGTYYLETSLVRLNPQDIWDLYNTIREVESSFREIKGDLGVRPNYHQNDKRIEGHIFISVLAYFVLSAIREKLKQKGCNVSWKTLKEDMVSQKIVTTSLKSKSGKQYFLRGVSEANKVQEEYYKLLSIKAKPMKIKRTTF